MNLSAMLSCIRSREPAQQTCPWLNQMPSTRPSTALSRSAPRGLETNRTPNIDDPVMAVGNALGEGIVIRDGLYTSQTPEVQDGRWQWLRFSAAASPGNSGGPLLDGVGRVIGLIEAKSPNENLNYALPIANILDA